jgi:hypothetical protein
MGILELAVLLLSNGVNFNTQVVPQDIVRQYGLNQCNCVAQARQLNPDLPYGLYSKLSKKRIVTTKEPRVGSTILTTEGYAGHAGTVLAVTETDVYFIEGNYKRCAVTVRRLPTNDKKILGYFT